MKILFPTDFSDASQKALHYFEDLSANLDVKVSVLNAYPTSNSPSRPFIEKGSYRSQIIQQVRDFVGDKMTATGKNVRYRAREGFPVQTIVEQSQLYDLIVMSKNETYSLLEQWLGSRSYRVAQRAYCPVLVLPHSTSFLDIEDIFVYEAVAGWGNHYMVEFLQRHWQARIHALEGSQAASPKSVTIHSTTFSTMPAFQQFVKEAGIELVVLKLKGGWKENNPIAALSKCKIFHNLQVPILAFNAHNLATMQQ